MKGRSRGYIVYIKPGGEFPSVWCVDCLAGKDTQDKLKEHCARHRPGAEFIGALIVPDEEPPA